MATVCLRKRGTHNSRAATPPVSGISRSVYYSSYNNNMEITYEDFLKVDIRVGKIIEVNDFPEARKPAFQLKIDFGPEIGIKQSSAQLVGAHTKEDLLGKLVCCVVNFAPKKIANFTSEVLTLGFRNSEGSGWVVVTPSKDSVKLGSRLA